MKTNSESMMKGLSRFVGMSVSQTRSSIPKALREAVGRVIVMTGATFCTAAMTSLGAATNTVDSAAALKLFSLTHETTPEVEQVDYILEQFSRRYKGTPEAIDLQKRLLEKHAEKWKKDILEGPSVKFKVAAVREHLDERQVADILEFYRSPLGIKYRALSKLTDSLTFEDAAIRVNLADEEQIRLSQLQTSGVLKVIHEDVPKVWYAYADSLTAYFRKNGMGLGKAIVSDPLLFGYPHSIVQDDAAQAERKQKEEITSMLNSNDTPDGQMSEEEIQRALTITMALKIPGLATPCSQYLVGWGASAAKVKEAAKRLGLDYQKDSIRGDDVVIVYRQATFIVDKAGGYYRIERRIRDLSESSIASQALQTADSERFAKEWTVLDLERRLGYAKCQSDESGVVVHARVDLGNEQLYVVERLMN